MAKTKQCKHCYSTIDKRATTCPHCGQHEKPGLLMILAAVLLTAPFLACMALVVAAALGV